MKKQMHISVLKFEDRKLYFVSDKSFSNASAFKDSSVAKKLKEKFTTRKCKGYDYADVKEYECTAGVLVIFLVQ